MSTAWRACRGIIVIVLALGAVTARAEEPAAKPQPLLKKGMRIAIVGDSITEQKIYSKYMELYLTACAPPLDLRLMQFGWNGASAGNFKGLSKDPVLAFKADLVTFAYGMNNGSKHDEPYREGFGKWYLDAMTYNVDTMKAAGASVIVGSSSPVDTKTFKYGNAQLTNDVLSHLAVIARDVAKAKQVPFTDVYNIMMPVMAKAKADFGEDYDVCGKDGVHPEPNGHLLMAYAFLKPMGLDGTIAVITLDMKGQAEASAGHKILSFAGGRAEIESTRYPFCFTGDEKSPAGTRSIVKYIPFNSELNRFMLVVKNLAGEKAKVTWGQSQKTFTRAELENGVNLADAFLDGTPFAAAFAALDAKIAEKELAETIFIKKTLTDAKKAGNQQEIETLTKQWAERHEKLSRAVQESLVPVKHTIVIEAEK